jgi:PilZ domain
MRQTGAQSGAWPLLSPGMLFARTEARICRCLFSSRESEALVLEQILPQPGDLTFPLLEADRRLSRRLPSDRLASCSTHPWSELSWARIRDLSSTGVGLFSSAPFEPGTSLILRLQSRVDCRSVSLVARVVHCSLHYSGQWIVGCRLDQKLPPDRLKALA